MAKIDRTITEVKGLREHDEELLMKHLVRHQELHKAVDELFADYIRNHPYQGGFIRMPIIDLIYWSAQQTNKPDHEE